METITKRLKQKKRYRFLPYLLGMETSIEMYKLTVISGSYRTYEEWKRALLDIEKELGIKVLTVPMRNGNGMSEVNASDMKMVLTVPMRNGNL